MVDADAEFAVVGIYARLTFGVRSYWWVLWAAPYDGIGRNDHWQPESSFYSADGTVTEVFEAFERFYPPEWGSVCLLDRTRFREALVFPYQVYGETPHPDGFDVNIIHNSEI
jgi:hypothetical protein